MKKFAGIIVLASAASAAGCLQKETTHTIYLSPDGRATWMALEQNVRSDERDLARRLAEEQEYIVAAETGAHGVGLGLAALNPSRVRTRIIRADRPFVVVTEAEFSSIELEVQRLLLELRLCGDVAVTHNDGVTTLRVRIDVRAIEEDDGPDTPVTALFEDGDHYRYVLTEGHFVAATGFAIEKGDVVAVPVDIPKETIDANGGVVEVSLSWTR